MSFELGWASLAIVPTFRDVDRQIERGTSKGMLAAGTSGGAVFGDAAGKSAGTRFGSVFKTAAKASLIGLAGAGALAVKFGGDAVAAASDLEESTNKVTQVFGKSADEIFTYTEAAADALGQTNTQARDAAATFGIFGQAANLSDRKSAKFAKRMTTLASDLASFNNTEPEDAVQALGAALRGESEPIRAYGVLLDEATLKAEALALGILKPVKNQAQIKTYQAAILDGQKKYNDAVAESGADSIEALKAEASLGTARDRLRKATEGTIPPLTQQQKLLAAQSQIFKQTDVAQGDFARTSDGLANQQRRLSARFENAKAALGKGLLPIMTDAADFLLDKGIPAFEDFSAWFTKTGVPALKDFGKKVKTVSGEVKDLAGFLDDLPKPAKIAGLTALVGGIGAAKLRGGNLGTGGVLGTAGKVLGLAKPVPVFVTNPGGLPGGVPGGSPKVPGGSTLGKAGIYGALLAAGVGSVYGVGQQLDAAVKRHPDAKPEDFGYLNDGYIDFSKPDEKDAEKSKLYYGSVSRSANAAERAASGLVETQKGLNRIFSTGQSDISGYVADLAGLRSNARSAAEQLEAVRTGVLNMPARGSYGNGLGVLAPEPKTPREPKTDKSPLIWVDKMVAQDYRDMQRQLQSRKQRAGLGGYGG